MSTISQTLRRMAREETPAPAKVLPTIEEVRGLSLRELGKSTLVLEVDSILLGETVLFTGNRVRLPADEKRVAYTARELEPLLGLSSDVLRFVHEVKKTFIGSRVSRLKREGRTL